MLFFGVNGTKFELIGLYETDIFVNSNKFFMCFYVVQYNTMVISEILERDFVTKPGVNLCSTEDIIQLDRIKPLNENHNNNHDALN